MGDAPAGEIKVSWSPRADARVLGDAPTQVDANALEAFACLRSPHTVPQELTKAERKALFEQQNKAKIEAAKAAKEQEKLSKKAESAAVAVRNSANKFH